MLKTKITINGRILLKLRKTMRMALLTGSAVRSISKKRAHSMKAAQASTSQYQVGIVLNLYSLLQKKKIEMSSRV